MKTTKKSEYDIQAETFLKDHDTTMEAVYLGHYPRLGDTVVSQWQVTFTHQGREPFVITFSQSIKDSWCYTDANRDNLPWRKTPGLPPHLNKAHWPKSSEQYTAGPYTIYPTKTPPSDYDVLACLTKSDPDTFDNFCADYGYDNDSIKALEVYRAVQKEWEGVRRVFGDCLEELQEIA